MRGGAYTGVRLADADPGGARVAAPVREAAVPLDLDPEGERAPARRRVAEAVVDAEAAVAADVAVGERAPWTARACAALRDDVDAAAGPLAVQAPVELDPLPDARAVRARGQRRGRAREQRDVAVGGETHVVDVRRPGALGQPRRVRGRAIGEAPGPVGRD